KNFRVSKDLFLDILKEIETKFPSVKAKGLTPKESRGKLPARGVGKDFNVAIAQPTFSVVFAKCLKILEETLAPKWITMEMEPDEQQEARRYFFAKSGIPGIVMCVDGTHIKIIAPINNRDQHYNRKGYYSLNALIVVFEQADAAYPAKPWIVTPHRNPGPGTAEADYNTKHSKGREIVQRTIELLKKWFRCLLGARKLHYSPEKSARIT
uniref:DDE Tnp4 domain-containing protein n=1 Tax=Anopheles dirus TaxID=7168 RepID=A0A182NT39_9DIPT